MSGNVLILLATIPGAAVGFTLRGLVDSWTELRDERRRHEELLSLLPESERKRLT